MDFTLKTFLLPLIDEQISRGDEVIAVCSEGKYTKDLRASGYQVETIAISRSFNVLSHLKSIYNLYKFLKNNSFDVVHVHTPIAAMIGRLSAFLARVPLVIYTAHGFYFHDDMNTVKRFCYIFAFVIGMICRLVKEKGVEEFLEAAREIKSDNENCYFLLIGEMHVHDHAEGVDASIRFSQKSLGKNLIVTGYRSDIPQLLSTMDLYVLPSWREGMPRSIIEAMMMGLPVLATDIRGSREEVIPNQTGLLVPVRSPRLLAAAMIKFISSPKWAMELGSNGRQRALEHYDEKRVVRFQLEIIEKYFKRL